MQTYTMYVLRIQVVDSTGIDNDYVAIYVLDKRFNLFLTRNSRK